MKTKPSNIDEVIFEQKDVEIFKIKDTKTKISTLQNYFFPRLEFVVRDALQWVQDIYEVNPYEKFTFVYRPSNRKDAKENREFSEVYVGISGKRQTDRFLTVKNKKGSPYKFHITYLVYQVLPEGSIEVQFFFYQNADKNYINSIKKVIKKNEELLRAVFNTGEISHSGRRNLSNFPESLKYDSDYTNFFLFSPTYYFPVRTDRGLQDLRFSFLILYPFLEATIDIAEGRKSCLDSRLEKFKEWWLTPDEDTNENDNEIGDLTGEDFSIQLPELESYKFVRAGLWWEVLARDKWTCKSCGRTPKDGVTLEVDHILPRSKGGTDEIKNLQTLCKKCNIGKSNKDDTDLR